MYDERRHRDQLSGSDRLCGGDVHLIRWAGLVLELPCIQHVCSRCDELLLQYGLLGECSDALDRRIVHAGRGGEVPGNSEWGVGVLYDERYLAHGQLSRGDKLCDRDLH